MSEKAEKCEIGTKGAKVKLNKENPELQYHTAWSNECIEFWFLLYFAYYTASNHRADYIAFLNDKFKELGIGKYQKNMKDIFGILLYQIEALRKLCETTKTYIK